MGTNAPPIPAISGGTRVAARTLRRTASARPARAAPASGGRVLLISLLLIWLVVAGVGLAYGLEYYLTPIQERAFSARHELLKPSGLIGQGYGVIGTLCMLVGVPMYSLRKRARILARAGKLKLWLQTHIFLCTLGPFLILLHTGFKIGGVVSIAFWSMVLVVLSGVFGRYIYAHIPKTIHGQFLTKQVIQDRKAELIQVIRTECDITAERARQFLLVAPVTEPKGFLHSLVLAFQYDHSKRSRKRNLRRLLSEASIPPHVRERTIILVLEQISLQQQIVLLQPFQRLFRYWHVFHLPLSTVMFLILLVHIAVAVLFGYTWVF